MIAVCREVDRATGRVAVYALDMEVTDELLFKLGLRARINPELQYYVTTKAHYRAFQDIITAVLSGGMNDRKSEGWYGMLDRHGFLGRVLPASGNNRCREGKRRVPLPLAHNRGMRRGLRRC